MDEERSQMAALARGDRQAMAWLIQRYGPGLRRFLAGVLTDANEAEDVAQECMLRLWRIAPDWRQGETKVTTWAYRVATNLCIDRQRSRKRKAQTALDDAPDLAASGRSADGTLIQADRMAALGQALGQLPDRQRQAVVLRHIEGLTNPEIAEVMQIGVEAVESLTARGKRALAALLSGQKDALGYEDERDDD